MQSLQDTGHGNNQRTRTTRDLDSILGGTYGRLCDLVQVINLFEPMCSHFKNQNPRTATLEFVSHRSL